jgi:hypothetical protein
MGPMEVVIEGAGAKKIKTRFLVRPQIGFFTRLKSSIQVCDFVDIVDGNGGVPGPAARKNLPGGKYNRKREQHVSFFAHAYRHYRQMRQSPRFVRPFAPDLSMTGALPCYETSPPL